jgi:hypothetical protein
MKSDTQKQENKWWWFLPLCLVIIGATAFLWVNVFIILGVTSDYGLIPCGDNCKTTNYVQVNTIEGKTNETIITTSSNSSSEESDIKIGQIFSFLLGICFASAWGYIVR